MFKFKQAIATVSVCAMLMTPAAAVYADETSETTSGSQTTQTTQADSADTNQADTTQSDTTQADTTQVDTAETSSVESIDLSGLSFDTMYGSQLNSFLNHQYVFNGEEIPLYESNFYFINAFLELSNYAYNGYYPSTSEGYLDLAATYDGDTYSTYADFYVDYAENMLESTCIICDMAESENLVLSDDTSAQIDTMIDNLVNNSATPAGVTLDEYLQLYYGPDMDETAFRDTLHYYYLSDLYSQNYCDNYQFTDEEKYVPNIRYALFSAPSGSDDATLTAAEDAANALLADCANTDDLATKAAALVDAGTVAQTNDIAVEKDKTVQEFEDWAYGAGRTEGEMAVVKSEDYGYFVVGYLGTTELDADSLSSIALAALSQSISDTISAGTYDFHTDMAYEPAVAVAAATDTTSTDASAATTDVSATDTTTAQADGVTTTNANIILIVLATVGAIAIVAVVVILVVFVAKDKGNGKKKINKDEADTEESSSEDESEE